MSACTCVCVCGCSLVCVYISTHIIVLEGEKKGNQVQCRTGSLLQCVVQHLSKSPMMLLHMLLWRLLLLSLAVDSHQHFCWLCRLYSIAPSRFILKPCHPTFFEVAVDFCLQCFIVPSVSPSLWVTCKQTSCHASLSPTLLNALWTKFHFLFCD